MVWWLVAISPVYLVGCGRGESEPAQGGSPPSVEAEPSEESPVAEQIVAEAPKEEVPEEEAVQLFGPSDIEVVSATFGTQGKHAEVAEAMREKLKTPDGWCGMLIIPTDFGIADPSPGWRKNLRMTLKIGGVERQFSPRNRTSLVIGAPGQYHGIVGTTAQPVEIGDMRVLAAWFGTEGHWIDVMPQLRAAVSDGRVDAGDAMGLVGKDPAPTSAKELRVYYERGGEQGIEVFSQNQAVVLPIEE